ncbi:elongation factor Ts [Monoraphidium neglectum]|uniref:Elongation factor Ts, mitochondrial n=1 Tax=Monoraphidium neglectum TaxID=145388 RepID=A0A0D2LLX4_9CHLO|nr:elongation factor Ts [Monoraphidium neglectum]KIY92799.1 elongation factor Ts [Monoraphidium neglectum]|eukprot:XP_013891819.1 elongation factor Ts [Monoraphidium neglectum]
MLRADALRRAGLGHVGDAISCFVLGVEGTKVELTQDLSSLALDDAVDEEGEELDYEEERLLARAEAEDGEVVASYDEEDEGADEAEAAPVSAGDAAAAVYYGQSSASAKAAASPAFIRGKRGAAIAPGAFPSRGFAVSDADLRVGAASRLIDIDDAGDEAELVDYWTDDVGRIGKGRLAALGAKIVVGEEGELQVVAREAAEGQEGAAAEEADALELLSGVSDRDLDDLVDFVLADDEEDEAELPFVARRNVGVFALSVETPTVSAADVKKLRQQTGAGMMDCKKAMVENGGDFEKATEWLRQKGLSGADKKAGRVATEGAVARYIHPGSRLGVLLEVNCETDFVAASEQFQSLVSELGMIVASTDVVCVSVDDMPGDLLEKERQVGAVCPALASSPSL